MEVVEPQQYTETILLDKEYTHIDDFHTGESGIARTGDGGDGGDAWWKIN